MISRVCLRVCLCLLALDSTLLLPFKFSEYFLIFLFKSAKNMGVASCKLILLFTVVKNIHQYNIYYSVWVSDEERQIKTPYTDGNNVDNSEDVQWSLLNCALCALTIFSSLISLRILYPFPLWLLACSTRFLNLIFFFFSSIFSHL